MGGGHPGDVHTALVGLGRRGGPDVRIGGVAAAGRGTEAAPVGNSIETLKAFIKR